MARPLPAQAAVAENDGPHGTDGRDRRRFRVSISFLAKAMLVVVLVWALANAAWLARDILFIAFLSVLLALFLSIFVDRLERFIPRGWATLVVLLVWLGGIAAFVAVAWPSLQGQIVTIREEVPGIVDDASAWVQDQIRAVAPGDGGEPTEEFTRQVNERMGTEAARIIAGALPLLNTVIGALSGAVIVLVAGLFLTVSPTMYLDGFVSLFPLTARKRTREALLEVGTTLRRWIGGVSIGMVTIMLLTTTGLWLLGVPAFLALGMLAGVLEFVPFIGPLLSAIPALALALTVSPTMVLWVALLYSGVQLIEANALTPLIMKQAVALPPALLLLFQMAMGVLFGFLGLLVAVPLLAMTKVLVQRLYVDRLDHTDAAI